MSVSVKGDLLARKTRALPLSPKALAEAAAILRRGGLVAFPTETVYGLGADAANPHAVAALYRAKGRPVFNPLIAHIAELAEAERIGHLDDTARRLADAFWPGPLTLVVPAVDPCPVCDLARAGLATVALRMPGHDGTRALLLAFGRAVVAPSANRSGHVSPTEAAHVMADLDGRIDLVLDGGRTKVGLESTIVACLPDAPPRLLRPGGVPAEAIEAALGVPLAARGAGGDGPSAPGMLPSHYAPAARLRLDAAAPAAGEAWLGFGPGGPAGGFNLSPAGDLAEAAANLFGYLRALDAAGPDVIAVAPVPDRGLGRAINDRLRRAAAPRP